MSDIPAMQPCPKCGIQLPFTPRPDTQHWGSITCPSHGFRWIAKPDTARKPRRKTNASLSAALPVAMQGFCWMCLRDANHLATLRPSVVLQVHHIIPVEAAGTDDPQNLMLLCAECHAEVHRRREAFARYENSIALAA